MPGYNIYYTMEALLSSELGDAAKGRQSDASDGRCDRGRSAGDRGGDQCDTVDRQENGGSDAGEAVGVSIPPSLQHR